MLWRRRRRLLTACFVVCFMMTVFYQSFLLNSQEVSVFKVEIQTGGVRTLGQTSSECEDDEERGEGGGGGEGEGEGGGGGGDWGEVGREEGGEGRRERGRGGIREGGGGAGWEDGTRGAQFHHEIQPILPVADFDVDSEQIDKPCKVVRMMTYKGNKMALAGSPVCQWIQKPVAMADRKFYKYGDEFALMYDVILHPDRRHPGARGGEEISSVWGQIEAREYIRMKAGYFELSCSQVTPSIKFMCTSSQTPQLSVNNYRNAWTKAIICNPNRTHDVISASSDVIRGKSGSNIDNLISNTNQTKEVIGDGSDVKQDLIKRQQDTRNNNSGNNTKQYSDVTSDVMTGLTLALERREYVNIYFVTLTIFNAFLVSLSLGVDPRLSRILLVDAHPRGGLDTLFETLFTGGVVRAGVLERPTRFSAMAWVPMADRSPLRKMKDPRVNYLKDFRHFVLEGYGLRESEISRPLNCLALRVLFLWRRDYVAHPRNKGGHVSRKFLNEDELLQSVIQLLGPQHRVEGRQLDADDMASQLGRVAGTDILIGMHGAGLVHTLYLPPHAHLVEIYPKTFPAKHQPFRAIASWRGLGYHTWQNSDNTMEGNNQATFVPVHIVTEMVNIAISRMCATVEPSSQAEY